MDSQFSDRLSANRPETAERAPASAHPDLNDSRIPALQTSVRGWLRALIAAAVHFLTGQQTLSVSLKQRGASLQWIVYDPDSQTRQVFSSEAAVRAWLEQRHYQ